jgi:hypothetical protein
LKYIFLILFFASSLFSQWHRITGEFYTLEYPEGYEAIADSLATITEFALPKLCNIINYDLDNYRTDPVHIYLTASKDISNGFAVENHVVIYATSSSYMERWTGKANWYQRLLTHELVHNIMYRKVERFPDWFGLLVQRGFDEVPRWFTEGLAQYYAEDWDYYRSDARLRNAVLNNQLSYARMVADLSLGYAAGHAFVRYLAHKYGDQKLVELMSYNANGWSFNFFAAFSNTYGISLIESFNRFTRDMTIYYGSKYQQVPNHTELLKPMIQGRIFQILRFLTDTSKYIIQSQVSPRDQFRTAFVVKKTGKSIKTLQRFTDLSVSDISLSPNDEFALFGSSAIDIPDDDVVTAYNWTVKSLISNDEYTVSQMERILQATFIDNNHVLLVVQNGKGTTLRKVNFKNKKTVDILKTQITIGQVRIANNQSILFTGQIDHYLRHIYQFNGQTLTKMTPNNQDVGKFEYHSKTNTVYYHVYENNLKTLWTLNLDDGKHHRIFSDQYDYDIQTFSAQENLIMKSVRFPKRVDIIELHTDSIQEIRENIYSEDPKSEWTQKQTEVDRTIGVAKSDISKNRSKEHDITSGMNLINGSTFLFPGIRKNEISATFSTVWFDPLQRHIFTINAAYNFTDNEFDFLFYQHNLTKWGFQFTATTLYTPAIFRFNEIKGLGLRRFLFDFEVNKPYYVGYSNREVIQPALFINYSSSEIRENPELKPIPEEANYSAIGASINYRYMKPSTLFPFMAKKRFGLSAEYFSTINDQYNFSTITLGSDIEHYIFVDEVTIDNRMNWITLDGTISPHDFVGIDHFYRFNTLKDIRNTRSIRGFDDDLFASDFIWHSTEISILLGDKTGMKALFIPLENMTLTGFYEGASISEPFINTIQSYGAELMFGGTSSRYGVGYATVEIDKPLTQTEKVYFRINVEL